MKLWGNLPEKEKAKAMQAIKREFPAHYEEAIKEYARLSSVGKAGK